MFLKDVRHAWRCPDRRCSMVSRDFACQLEGYGLTTASILYRMPDHRSILQEFIWQEYDLNPVYFEKRSFSSSGSSWSFTQRRSAMTKGSRFRRVSKSAARRIRSSALAWQ